MYKQLHTENQSQNVYIWAHMRSLRVKKIGIPQYFRPTTPLHENNKTEEN